mmetsp:Transcript_5811/g.8759  ORF Transcript_5811/g.8759 Transcript_5811/m.8759 type:complete len:576 (+) Transcript_5811:21-1748(+)
MASTRFLSLLCVLVLCSLYRCDLVCKDGICDNDSDIPEQTELFFGKTFHYDSSLQKLQRDAHKDKDIYGAFLYPHPLPDCELVDLNEEILAQFFAEEIYSDSARDTLRSYICGQDTPPGSQPFAHRYGGLQFAKWAELGDGRALSWGNIRPNSYSSLSLTSPVWEFQVKGSGITPYSRDGDGRAVLRSSIREYLGSWAMFGLGVPTSLVGGIVRGATPTIRRDPFYDGNFITEHAAITLRLSPSWLRFGSFQILKKNGEEVAQRKLIAYTIDQFFPFLLNDGETTAELFQSKTSPRASEITTHMLNEIILRTARLIGQWKAHGFCHGVMNTDNMSILGLTIDYGPFGFMEKYNPEWVCNFSDDNKRYKFDTQESVGMWNVKQFADSLAPYVSIYQQVRALGDFFPAYKEAFVAAMSLKLGFNPEVVLPIDETIVESILELIVGADYHQFFRVLSSNMGSGKLPPRAITELLTPENAKLFESWWKFMDKRRELSGLTVREQRKIMLKHNPIYVLRNHIAEKAIKDAEEGNFETVRTLRRILRTPFTKDPDLSPEEQKFFSSPPSPDAEPIIVSCSS